MKIQKILQKISNSPVFESIEREIQIAGIVLNFDLQSLDLFYTISYFKDGENVSQLFKKEVPEWHIDNNQTILVRDESFNPVVNPDYIEHKDDNGNVTNSNKKFLTEPAFDYVSNIMLNTPMKLSDILQNYIKEQDTDKRFDFKTEERRSLNKSL